MTDVDDDFDGLDLAAERAIGLEAMRSERWSMLVPSRFLWAKVDDFADRPSFAASLVEWGAGGSGNLVLLGPVGTGKTHAAIAAGRPRFHRGATLAFRPVVELLDELRPGGPDGAFADLVSVDVLVLDDAGTERPTDWTAERLYALVNRRWLEERPIIATSNLAADELRDALGARTFSRLVGSGALVLTLSGGDRRG